MKAGRLHLPAIHTDRARPSNPDPDPMRTARRAGVRLVLHAMLIRLIGMPTRAEAGRLDRVRRPRKLDPHRMGTVRPNAGLLYAPWASL